MVMMGIILIMAVVVRPITVLAASSEEVTISGTGTITPSSKETEEKPPSNNDNGDSPKVGTVSKINIPKTGDWSDNTVYMIVMLSGLVVLLSYLFIKWHREYASQ